MEDVKYFLQSASTSRAGSCPWAAPWRRPTPWTPPSPSWRPACCSSPPSGTGAGVVVIVFLHARLAFCLARCSLQCLRWTSTNSLMIHTSVPISAANRSIGSTTDCTITEKAPTRAFSWLKAATTAFTFKTLLRHYAKRVLTPRSLNVKLGPRRNYHEGRAAIRHYANQPACPL